MLDLALQLLLLLLFFLTIGWYLLVERLFLVIIRMSLLFGPSD